MGALSGNRVNVENGQIHVTVRANSGEIWLPVTDATPDTFNESAVELNVNDAVKDVPTGNEQAEAPAQAEAKTIAPEAQPASAKVQPEAPAATETPAPEPQSAPANTSTSDAERDSFERGKIAGLQEAILAIMEKKGPVTDQMRRDVENNVYHDSLINWVKSFN